MNGGAADGIRARDFEMPHLRRDLNDPDLVLGNPRRL